MTEWLILSRHFLSASLATSISYLFNCSQRRGEQWLLTESLLFFPLCKRTPWLGRCCCRKFHPVFQKHCVERPWAERQLTWALHHPCHCSLSCPLSLSQDKSVILGSLSVWLGAHVLTHTHTHSLPQLPPKLGSSVLVCKPVKHAIPSEVCFQLDLASTFSTQSYWKMWVFFFLTHQDYGEEKHAKVQVHRLSSLWRSCCLTPKHSYDYV